MPVRTVNGSPLYYEVSGRGMPLVFLHEHGLTHEMFKPQTDYFRNRCLVVTVDLRGNGHSGRLEGSSDTVCGVQCEDVSLLLGHLGIRRAVLVGVGYGSVVAQLFAVRYPEQVLGLVLADTPAGHAPKGPALQAALAASWLSAYLPGELALRSLRILYSRWGLAYQTLRKGLLHKRPGDLHKQRLAAARLDCSTLLTRIRVPALCLAGEHSPPDLRQMKEAAGMLPCGRFAVIPDSLAPSNLCSPDQFNAAIERFLNEETLLAGAEAAPGIPDTPRRAAGGSGG
ncbi:alpha/beta hydrolase [Paenibacillus sp. J31TS4]|uniref:alpha/beta fold hydrolase n=1 Tax=Paenibacillus sp. J31TS4 TaxID=2807195 RepID=UPI001B29EA4D|nr:alpha/beta hydrolase [Paenibacillus sp. J31TS4]GIP37839.1 alpha/beta hydrolase [Paenibacillus sp. J31TS4]